MVLMKDLCDRSATNWRPMPPAFRGFPSQQPKCAKAEDREQNPERFCLSAHGSIKTLRQPCSPQPNALLPAQITSSALPPCWAHGLPSSSFLRRHRCFVRRGIDFLRRPAFCTAEIWRAPRHALCRVLTSWWRRSLTLVTPDTRGTG